jgi:putative ubiquitin-RnfH superfamily antitoxin RatB of RatAB toxin-antitoxin module
MIKVQIVYALADKQTVIDVKIDEKSTIQQAIEKSGILIQYPEIDLKVNKVGLYSRLKTLDTIIQDDDRIEIYRPLKVIKKIKETKAIIVEN